MSSTRAYVNDGSNGADDARGGGVTNGITEDNSEMYYLRRYMDRPDFINRYNNNQDAFVHRHNPRGRDMSQSEMIQLLLGLGSDFPRYIGNFSLAGSVGASTEEDDDEDTDPDVPTLTRPANSSSEEESTINNEAGRDGDDDDDDDNESELSTTEILERMSIGQFRHNHMRWTIGDQYENADNNDDDYADDEEDDSDEDEEEESDDDSEVSLPSLEMAALVDDQGNTVRRDSQGRVVHITREVSPDMLKQVRVQASCNIFGRDIQDTACQGFHCDRMVVRNESFSYYVEPMNEETENEDEGEGEEKQEEEEEEEEEEEHMGASEYNVIEMLD